MKRIVLQTNYMLALVVAGILATGTAIADKPSWADGGKGGKSEHKEKKYERRDNGEITRDHAGPAIRMNEHFGDQRRVVVRDYYREQFRTGRCPPGLAKKHNGCMPPGQARKWTVGRPLPRDVVYYNVPQTLIVQIGQPPAGHRYVRVATDILLIAIGTGMVIDAIEDIGGM